jgi:hypothetical protein
VKQWSGRRNPKEEEEGVFIPTSPELAVGGFLRPGRVTRHGWPGHPPPSSTVPVARPLVPVDPVGVEGEGSSSQLCYFVEECMKQRVHA